ncbi:MAG: hypothetical protein R3308_11405, partial [Thiohalobacterales bacterium]|nr:hypothetical protein [Thiohalobacterales bacterium]
MDTQQCVIVVAPARPGKAVWDRIAHADVIRTRLRRAQRRDPDCRQVSLDLPNSKGTRVLLQLLDGDSSTFAQLTTARKLAGAVRELDPGGVLVQIAGFDDAGAGRIAASLVAALLASVCPMPSYKSEQAPEARLARIQVFGVKADIDLPALQAEAMGNHLARWLAAMP